ncbi:NAD(P)/FAD-dependent oxidoreductase [Chloroflexota bacterium]
MKKHVIVGNGGAALSCINAIRSLAVEDGITVLSMESCLAYSPVLLTHYLAGTMAYQDMFLGDKAFYQASNVTTLLGRKVVKVEPARQRVLLEDAHSVEYDDLLVATGSSPSIPPIEGVDLPGIFTLNTADDASAINAALEGAESVAVVGAGLIGMQALAAVVTRGKKAILIEIQDQIFPLTLDKVGARLLETKLRENAVEIYLNETLRKVDDEKGRRMLFLASGRQVTADLIILALGVNPNTDLVKGSGVQLAKGILVDEHCRTNIEDIYAAGDVAESIDPITGRSMVNATWPNAIEQGMAAGFNMAGKETRCRRNLRFNTFTLFDLPCASIGYVTSEAGLQEVAHRDGDTYRKLVFRDGILVGAVLIGDMNEAGILASLVDRQTLFPDLQQLAKSGAFSYYARTLLRS